MWYVSIHSPYRLSLYMALSLVGTVQLVDSHSSSWFFLPFPAPCSSCTKNVCHITHTKIKYVGWPLTKQNKQTRMPPLIPPPNTRKLCEPALKTTQSRGHQFFQFPSSNWTVNMTCVQRLPPYKDHLFLSKIDHYRQVSLQTILQLSTCIIFTTTKKILPRPKLTPQAVHK